MQNWLRNSTCSAHVSCSCHTMCCPRWLNRCFLQAIVFFSPSSQSSRSKQLNATKFWIKLRRSFKSDLILNSVYVLFLKFEFRIPLFPFSFIFPSIFHLFPLEFWSKSKLILNLILHFIYFIVFPFCLICPFFFLRFFLSFFPSFFPLFFQLSFLFRVPFSFPFLIIKVFYFSDTLNDNLAIT